MNHQQPVNQHQQNLNQAEPTTFPQPAPHVAPRRGVFTLSDSLGGASPAPGPPAPRPTSDDRAAAAPSYLSLADPYLRKIAEDNARCQYRDSAGRRCRGDRQRGDPTFCPRHRRALLGPDETPALDTSGIWEDLLGPLRDFRTATGINFTLGRLLLLRASGSVSARDASVIAYICQLLLQSLPQVEKELDLAGALDQKREQIRRVLQETTPILAPAHDARLADEPPASEAATQALSDA